MRLEDLRPRCSVRGVHPDGLVTVISAHWFEAGLPAVRDRYRTARRRAAGQPIGQGAS